MSVGTNFLERRPRRRSGALGFPAFKSSLPAALFNDRFEMLDMRQRDSLVEELKAIFRDVGALEAAGRVDTDEATRIVADMVKFALSMDLPLSSAEQSEIQAAYEEGQGLPYEAAFPRPEEGLFRNDGRSPMFPLDVLPNPFWTFAHDTAQSTGMPLDYLCGGLLSAAAAAMGRTRLVTTVLGTKYEQPPILWIGAIGSPAQAKSPALKFSKSMLEAVEASLGPENEKRMLEWKSHKAAADAARKQWDDQVKKAVAEGTTPPIMPPEAIDPPPQAKDRIMINDPTPESVIQVCASLPRGVLLFRDELAGWWNSFGRYSQGGGEREMWLEAHDGGSWSSERVKFSGTPLEVSALAVSIVGGTQPAKIRELVSGPADGLVERFLWMWPKSQAGTLTPMEPVKTGACVSALKRLRGLDFQADEGCTKKPRVIPLSAEALSLFDKFKRQTNDEAEVADEQEAGAIGKSDKQVIRLALVLEFMAWAGSSDKAEPEEISARSMKGAIILWRDYFVHHLRLVVESAGGGRALGAARDLAKWIVNNEVKEFTRTQVRRNAGMKSLKDAQGAQAAIEELCEADWLFPNFSREGGRKGRTKQEYVVNPHVHAGGFRCY